MHSSQLKFAGRLTAVVADFAAFPVTAEETHEACRDGFRGPLASLALLLEGVTVLDFTGGSKGGICSSTSEFFLLDSFDDTLTALSGLGHGGGVGILSALEDCQSSLQGGCLGVIRDSIVTLGVLSSHALDLKVKGSGAVS